MVSFQRLPLPVLNPGWSLQSPQGSQKILIIPRDPHPKIKITQSKTATVHHTKPSKKDFIPAGADSAHTARYASQHPEGFLFFLCLSWALYSEPDAGTSKAARNDFPGTARAFYQKGRAHSPWEGGTESVLQGASPPTAGPACPPPVWIRRPRALSTNTADTESGAGTRFCNPQNRTFHQLETESASPGCPGGNSDVSGDPTAGPSCPRESALLLLADPSSARWPAHPAQLPPRRIQGRAAVAPGTPPTQRRPLWFRRPDPLCPAPALSRRGPARGAPTLPGHPFPRGDQRLPPARTSSCCLVGSRSSWGREAARSSPGVGGGTQGLPAAAAEVTMATAVATLAHLGIAPNSAWHPSPPSRPSGKLGCLASRAGVDGNAHGKMLSGKTHSSFCTTAQTLGGLGGR